MWFQLLCQGLRSVCGLLSSFKSNSSLLIHDWDSFLFQKSEITDNFSRMRTTLYGSWRHDFLFRFMIMYWLFLFQVLDFFENFQQTSRLSLAKFFLSEIGFILNSDRKVIPRSWRRNVIQKSRKRRPFSSKFESKSFLKWRRWR